MIERFQSFLLINPNFAEGYYFIGIASAHLNNYADAAIHLKRAIELDTPEIDYHSSHGLSYHDFDAHMAYADILIKLDRKTEAIEQIEKALLIRPKDQRALSIKKRL
jgi:tetratricopeptide (TPR) repeat protein